MIKKYIVRLTDAERELLKDVVGKFKGMSQKVRRAQVLRVADADGPGWTDAKIAKAFGCRIKTVENIRDRYVTVGFETTRNDQPRLEPPSPKLLDGEQEAEIIAMHLGSPSPGFSKWTLRLRTEQVLALEIVESVSYETVRRTFKRSGMTQREIDYWLIPPARRRDGAVMSKCNTVLLESHLKTLRLPTFVKEYANVARQAGERGDDHEVFLEHLAELEVN